MAVVDAGIIERIKQVISVLEDESLIARAVYLFGSHLKGNSDRWSDIDVAIFIDDIQTWDIWQKIELIVEVQNKVGFDIELHLFPAESLENSESGSFACDIIRNGYRII